MSSSPKEPSTMMSSPTRYHNRYSERYKSLLTESPPRDFNSLRTPEKATHSTLKNSPLQSNREHRIFEGEKYTTLKIKNEDRGEWRENVLFNEENVDEVEQVKITKSHSPYQGATTSATATMVVERETAVLKKTPPPIQRKSNTPIKEDSAINYRQEKRSRQPQTQQHEQHEQHEQQRAQHQTQQQQTHKRGVPHYMQVTSSYESRVHSNKERRSHSNLLGPRSKGGITKRVGTAKVPRYHATTTINAIEDIQSEMQPDDVYIPMAARIKLFEKGLGNGSNKSTPLVRQSSSSSTTNSQPKPQSSRSITTRNSPIPADPSLPSYARRTVASETKERTKKISRPTASSSSSQRSRTTPAKSVIASSEMDKSFNEKLNLWKGKDKMATLENYRNRGSKRKNEHPHPTSRHKK